VQDIEPSKLLLNVFEVGFVLSAFLVRKFAVLNSCISALHHTVKHGNQGISYLHLYFNLYFVVFMALGEKCKALWKFALVFGGFLCLKLCYISFAC
jgi:hypothetical protein